jgi:hypothetical protein
MSETQAPTFLVCRLNLRGHFLGAELGKIAALTALTELDISAASWTWMGMSTRCNASEFNEGLAHIATLNKLQRLNLANTVIDKEGICNLCSGLQVIESPPINMIDLHSVSTGAMNRIHDCAGVSSFPALPS